MTVHGLIKTAAIGTAVATAASLALLGPTTTATGAASAPGAEVRTTNGCLTSVPDPGTDAPVQICYTLFKPAGADAQPPGPVHHAQPRLGRLADTDPAAFKRWLDAGYGVLSFDQRGFGESGGTAYVENPRVEGHDVRALVKLVAHLRWVKKDGPGDPRLGAIGGSYGGGYQFLGAFEELRVHGQAGLRRARPRDHLERPQHQPRPAGRGAHRVGARARRCRRCPARRCRRRSTRPSSKEPPPASGPTARSPAPRTSRSFSSKNGPAWHVSQGRRLDIPVLFGQGLTDTLFNLQQGLDNWRTAITKRARKHSIFVGYNGGHTLPAVYPQGVDVASDPCSKSWPAVTSRRSRSASWTSSSRARHGLKGYGKLHLATPPRPVRRSSTVAADNPVAVGHGRHHRDRRRRHRLPGGPGSDPDRRVRLPHRHHDGPRRQQPRVLRTGGRHQPARRQARAKQRDAVQRARARHRRAPPDRAAGRRGRRTRRARRSL